MTCYLSDLIKPSSEGLVGIIRLTLKGDILEEKESKSKKHFYLSLVKSGIRIEGCIMAGIFENVIILCIFLALAELIGIWEEL